MQPSRSFYMLDSILRKHLRCCGFEISLSSIIFARQSHAFFVTVGSDDRSMRPFGAYIKVSSPSPRFQPVVGQEIRDQDATQPASHVSG